MPDRAEVEQALAALLAGALYPTGEAPAVGTACKIYRGWPVASTLERDLAQGCLHVTVQPVAGSRRETTRYSSDWQGVCSSATLAAVVVGTTVTFQGVGGAGHVAGIRVDDRAYAYRMQAGDTASLVAAVLASDIRADRPAVAAGSSVQLANARGLIARVVTDGIGGQELRRQVAGFRVTFWCPDPTARDDAVSMVDASLAGMAFMDVGGWACRIKLSGDSSSDEAAAGGIWRRDLLYSIEYPTTSASSLPAMLFGIVDVNAVAFVG